MTRVRFILAAGALFLTCACTVVLTTVEKEKARLAASLRIGSDPSVLLAYCQKRKMEVTGPRVYRKFYSGTSRDSMNLLWPEIDGYPVHHYYDANIRTASYSFWVVCGIYMRFYYDKNDRLLGYVLDRICTGP